MFARAARERLAAPSSSAWLLSFVAPPAPQVAPSRSYRVREGLDRLPGGSRKVYTAAVVAPRCLTASPLRLPFSPSAPALSPTSARPTPSQPPLLFARFASSSPGHLPPPPSSPSSSPSSSSIFGSFLRPSRSPSLPPRTPADLEEERRNRERNIETAKALERTLRSTRGTGYGGGGGGSGTMDIRTTTLDSKGTVTTMSSALSKQELCAKFSIPPRDLRKLDSGVPTVVPTILSRKSCLILTILHLRVVITARDVTIFDSVGSEDSWLKGVFIWSLEHALKTTTKTAHGLPYEFRALEACLVNVLTALETDLVNIRSHVVELLAHMEEHIDRDNLRLMLQYSRKLSIFQKRTTLVQECLDELLSNDADLAAMYLSAKLAGKPRAADDHEEIELLLESFSKQCEEICSEVETLSANVRHTEDIVELILDANRNSLLGLDLRVSIATLGLTAGAMIAALFGMLTSHLEETPFAFPAISLFSFAAAVFVTTVGIRRLNRLRKVNLGWREELRQVGDRWGRGQAKKGSKRRRD